MPLPQTAETGRSQAGFKTNVMAIALAHGFCQDFLKKDA
jgi:hypothetical protein